MFKHIYHTRIVWAACLVLFAPLAFYIYRTHHLSLNQCGMILVLAIAGFGAWQQGAWLKAADEDLNGKVRVAALNFYDAYVRGQLEIPNPRIENGGVEIYIKISWMMEVQYSPNGGRLVSVGKFYEWAPIGRWEAYRALKELAKCPIAD